MENIKQKAREIWETKAEDFTYEDMDSIIDLAIAERDKEIVEMIKETQKTIRLEQFTVDTIINLINSKK